MTDVRYYLHIRDNDRFIADPEGIVVQDLNAVWAHATAAAMELAEEGLLPEQLTDRHHFEVTDEAGEIRARFMFSDLCAAHRAFKH